MFMLYFKTDKAPKEKQTTEAGKRPHHKNEHWTRIHKKCVTRKRIRANNAKSLTVCINYF